jgi:hypothetical protein
MKWLFQSYYLINILVASIYPLFRLYQSHYYTKNNIFYQSSAYERESHVIISFFTLVCIKYVRYFTSVQQIVYETLFYSKLAFLFLFFLYSYLSFFWYFVVLALSWIFVKVPTYDGPTKLISLIGESRFEEFVLNKKNKNSKLNNYSLVVYYSPFSDKCTFVSFI